MTNKIIASFSTFLLCIILSSFLFSFFKLPKIVISEEKIISINFSQLDNSAERESFVPQAKNKEKNLKKNYKEEKDLSSKNNALFESIDRKDRIKREIKKELSEISLSRELKIISEKSLLIQKRISNIWIQPNTFGEDISTRILLTMAPSGELMDYKLTESSGSKIFDESALLVLSKIDFFPEISNLERNLFEKNFRNFNLVFKSSGRVE